MKTFFLVLSLGLMLSGCSTNGPNPNELQFQRAQAACAQVDPRGSADVGSCAARMQAVLSSSSQ
jgi:PBP1b-binding outer membrane lipoprotein LpoB